MERCVISSCKIAMSQSCWFDLSTSDPVRPSASQCFHISHTHQGTELWQFRFKLW
jgi:hypothetical protein